MIVANNLLTFLDLRSGETSEEKKLKMLKSKEREAYRVECSQGKWGHMGSYETTYDLPANAQYKKAKKELEEYSSSFVPPIRNEFSLAAKQQLEFTVRKINATRPMKVMYPN